eukprot:3942833-Prymnesium_polylepis.1
MRCYCPTDDATGSETRSAGSTRGHAHCPEDHEYDARMHMTNKISRSIAAPDVRPARNNPPSPHR